MENLIELHIALVRTLVFSAMMRFGNKMILSVHFKCIPKCRSPECFDAAAFRSFARTLVSSKAINKLTRSASMKILQMRVFQSVNMHK